MRPDVFGGGRVKGEWGTWGCRRCTHDECGQVAVLFALLLPMLLALGAIVLCVGNWYTHATPPPDESRCRRIRRGHGLGLSVRRGHRREHRGAGAPVRRIAHGSRRHGRREPAQPAAERRRRRPDLREPQPGSMVERKLSGSRLLRSARPGVPVEDPRRKGDGGRHAAPLARHSVLPGHQAQGSRPDRGDLGPHRAAADRRAPSAAAQRSGRLLRRGDDLEADPRCRAAPARVHRRRALLLRRRAGRSRTVDHRARPRRIRPARGSTSSCDSRQVSSSRRACVRPAEPERRPLRRRVSTRKRPGSAREWTPSAGRPALPFNASTPTAAAPRRRSRRGFTSFAATEKATSATAAPTYAMPGSSPSTALRPGTSTRSPDPARCSSESSSTSARSKRTFPAIPYNSSRRGSRTTSRCATASCDAARSGPESAIPTSAPCSSAPTRTWTAPAGPERSRARRRPPPIR